MNKKNILTAMLMAVTIGSLLNAINNYDILLKANSPLKILSGLLLPT